MLPPPPVLTAFPPVVRDCSWTLLPPGGGLGGGQVWRGDLNGEPLFALKRWPLSHVPGRLQLVHDRMKAVADLNFVPRIEMTPAGQTLVVQAGRCWDVVAWKPGTPTLLDGPSIPHLVSASIALAGLHRGWLPTNATTAPCSAIARRLQLLTEWSNTRFSFTGRPDEVAELMDTLDVVRTRVSGMCAELRRFAPLRGRHAAIHGDFWPENVLFNRFGFATGILDFGNVGFDHPEVDLGRLLADVPAADGVAIRWAVEGYNANAPFEMCVPLVELLASTGRLGSLANWHLRLNAGLPDERLLSAALPRIRRLVLAIRVAGGN